MKENSNTNRLTKALLIIYLIALVWIIIFKFHIPLSFAGNLRSINLIPFSASVIINGRLHYSEIVMNVVIFVPLGIYAEILFNRWNIGKKLFLFFLISFLCEALQYILAVGVSDITDILTNTFGGIIGLVAYKGIEKGFKNSVQAQKFMNAVAVAGTVFMALLIFLLIRYNIWMFRS